MKSRLRIIALACLLCAGLAQARVNVNTATAEELESLQGIGTVRAQAIIDYRSQHGQFKSNRDLMKVPDIPESVVKGLKGKVAYSGSARSAETVRNPNVARNADDPKTGRTVTAQVPVGPPAAPMKPKALPAPVAKQAESAASSAAPVQASPARAAAPASPARPAMPGKPATPSSSGEGKSASNPAPARPALPGKVTSEAKPVSAVAPAAPALPRPAVPASAH